MVSMKSTPPSKVACRMPPIPSADKVASTGLGNPIAWLHEDWSSDARIRGTRSMLCQTVAEEAAISITLSTLRMSWCKRKRGSKELSNMGRLITQTSVASRVRRERTKRTIAPAAAPPKLDAPSAMGVNITMQIKPSHSAAAVAASPAATGSQGNRNHIQIGCGRRRSTIKMVIKPMANGSKTMKLRVITWNTELWGKRREP